MSELEFLRAATQLQDVATLLSTKPKALAYILYVKPLDSRYKVFEIPKRSGGSRSIHAPVDELKLIQQKLAKVLQNCVEEINISNHWRDSMVHGFMRGRSIFTNAVKHRKRRHIAKIDLKDFFESINFGRVRGFFLKNKRFLLNPELATVLAQISCYSNSLPQGSPCSPVISNLIAHSLDMRLSRLANEAGCTYTRYADDITFSSNKRDLLSSIVKLDDATCIWKASKKLEAMVSKEGFFINVAKTRMLFRTSRQEVTGLVVNKKVNVKNEYRKLVRAMTHRLFTTGSFEIKSGHSLNGTIEHSPTKPGSLDQLHGMLGYIDSVDLFNRKRENKDPVMQGIAGPQSLKKKESLYRSFLFFKDFYVAEKPVILCEGKTDNIYVLHALRSLATKYPLLVTCDPSNQIKLLVRIYKYTKSSTGRLLGLRGGTGDIKSFIANYVKELERFKAPGESNPVIILIDNDDGAKAIYSMLKQYVHRQVTGSEEYLHIASNLYVVPTPPKNGFSKTKIEDFFDSATLKIRLRGKTFDAKGTSASESSYGKHIFATEIIEKNADQISFEGFTPLLDRIAKVVVEHSRRSGKGSHS